MPDYLSTTLLIEGIENGQKTLEDLKNAVDSSMRSILVAARINRKHILNTTLHIVKEENLLLTLG